MHYDVFVAYTFEFVAFLLQGVLILEHCMRCHLFDLGIFLNRLDSFFRLRLALTRNLFAARVT